MKTIVEIIKEKLLEYSKKDGYDRWNNHIKYVFQNAQKLAIKHNADMEICELAALFHDMSMVAEVGPKEEHPKYGAQMAHAILTELNYPKEKTELVEKCVLHHSIDWNGSRDTMEEKIIADADAIAHFDKIPGLFYLAYAKRKLPLEEGAEFVKNKLIGDYNKLSPQSQKELKERFDNIMRVLFVN